MNGAPYSRSTDGVLGLSGKAIRVYAICIDSTAGGASVVAFHNGTSASDTKFLTGTGTVSKAVLVPDIPASGLLFPSGLYVDVDGNTNNVTVWLEVVSRN